MPVAFFRRLRRRGASMLEYAFLVGLIASASLGAVMLLGGRTSDLSERTGAIVAGDLAPPGMPVGMPLEGVLPGHLLWGPPFVDYALSPGQPRASATLTLMNTGGGRSLPFAPPAVVGSGVGAFSIVATDCPDSLGAGESCTISVEAAAADNGIWEARLEAAGAPGGVHLRAEATGFAPAFAWSGDGLFALDGASATPAAAERTFALSNIGTLRGAPAPVVVSGAGFSLVSTTCGPALEIGETCQATVRATAADNGPLSGQLASGDALLPLLGAASGFAAQLTWEGSPVFEIAGPAATPAALERTFSLRNDGTLAATGLAVAFSGDTSGPVAFSLLSTTCGSTLGVGERCDAVVRLTATADGAATAWLSSGGAMPAEISLVGDASGIAPVLVWSGPASVSLDGTPPQALPVSGQTTVTLSNTGNQDAAGLGALAVSGAGWALLGTTCGPTLAQGAACTATLALETAANGAFPGLLAGANIPDLPLAGSAAGFAPAWAWSGGGAFTLTAPASNPATVERTFTLTNVGTLAGTPPTPTVSGSGAGFAYSLVSHSCGASIAIGATCEAVVRATFTDNVAAADGILGGPAVQSLTGSAAGFAAVLVWQSVPTEFGMDADTGSNTAAALPAPGPTGTAVLRNGGTLASGPITVALAGADAGAFEIVSNGCGGIALAPGATCQVQTRLRSGVALGSYSLQLSATASPTVLSPARVQRARGALLVLVADNGAALSHGNWGSQGAVREWRIRNQGNRDAQNLQVGGLQGTAFNWALYTQSWGLVAHGGNPWATITLAPGQEAILHAALFSGQQLSASSTTSWAATVLLGGVQWAAISGTYIAAPALTWTGGGGHAMDTNANGALVGHGVWSAWHRLWLQNTGNTGVWMGDGIVPNTWDRVAHWGTHTCLNRWLWPGESCFRDVAHLYTTNEWIGRDYIAWGHSTNPGWRGLWGQAFNYRQPTWQFRHTTFHQWTHPQCPFAIVPRAPSTPPWIAQGTACWSPGSFCEALWYEDYHPGSEADSGWHYFYYAIYQCQ